jgi:hypothetical protein
VEVSAVSDGLVGKENNADVMRVGDMSSGFGGLMDKPWVEILVWDQQAFVEDGWKIRVWEVLGGLEERFEVWIMKSWWR